MLIIDQVVLATVAKNIIKSVLLALAKLVVYVLPNALTFVDAPISTVHVDPLPCTPMIAPTANVVGSVTVVADPAVNI